MKIRALHSWDISRQEAPALQKELAGQVDASKPLASWNLVAGADVSYNRFSPTCYAGVVVLRVPNWEVVEVRQAVRESHFPYIPGLLSFREAPALLEAFAKVQTQADVVIIEGQGRAHPRRLGIASHMGLLLQVPTVGFAKSLLYGKHDDPPGEAGTQTLLMAGEEVIGAAVRTKKRCNPVYVSVGHLIDLASAVRVVLSCCRGYRLPEPTRQAHLHVNALRRRANEQL
jgi:deoxyribonuclease V